MCVLALFTLHSLLSAAFAQGTAFTYQGRLNSCGAPANGSYDIAFTLYDSTNVPGNVIAGPVTNSAVCVSHGLFTTMVDFGGVFTGGSNWLEVAVSLNGANVFSTLSPRQQLTPVPYAIEAESANSVSTTNIIGTIADNQLSTNVALLSGSPNFAGTVSATNFSGNGAGLTNVPGTLVWQVVSGTNQTAASGSGYLATNNAQVVVTLPASPNVGDVVAISGSGASGWKIAQLSGQSIKTAGAFSSYAAWTNHFSQSPPPYSIASSADGTMLVFGGSGTIYTSSDAGITWTLRTNFVAGYYVASSTNAGTLFAIGSSGYLYTSTNFGAAWVQQSASPYSGTAIVCSSDGTKAYVISGSSFYYSPDSGVDWITRSGPVLSSVAVSADGTKLVGGSVSSIYTSTNSGTSWTLRTNFLIGTIYTVASSADGTRLAAAPQNGPIYTSADSGATWTAQNSGNQYWYAIASSSDGTKLIAGTGRNGPGVLYTSSDSGVTWIAQNSGTNYWKSTAISADGSRLAAAASGYAPGNSAGVYISQSTNLTKTTLGALGYLLGGQNAAVQLQCIGNGQFILLNQEGTLYGF